jgi:hypothetical protein
MSAWGGASLGFSGNSCAAFASAYTVWRWDRLGAKDGWSMVSCDVDVLPLAGGSFVGVVRNADGGAEQSLSVSVVQADGWPVFTPSSGSDGLPPTADIAAVWSAGFTLVVMCFFISRSIGSVLNFLRRR